MLAQFERLVELRKVVGITQEELAGQLGITRGYLAQLETGKHEAPPELRRKMQDSLMTLCIVKVRSAMDSTKRLHEAFEVNRNLRSIRDISELVRTRVLAIEIRELETTSYFEDGYALIEGGTARHLWSESYTVDLVLIDEYSLDDLVAEVRALKNEVSADI